MGRELFKCTATALEWWHSDLAGATQVAGFLARYPLCASLFPKKAQEIH